MKFQRESTQRYEFLDGLRGIAALLVVLFHFNNLLKDYSIHPFSQFIDWILNRGHCGVEIFFILSGFVIAYSIRSQSISSHFALTFFIRRSVRLDPPYWITLCCVIGLSMIGNLFKTTSVPLPDYTDVLTNFFYLADLLQIPRILPVSWTLFLEIQFYLFLILFVKFLQFVNTISSSGGSFLKMSFISYILLVLLMTLSILQNTPYHLLPSIPGLFLDRWYSFFIGCLACWSMLKMIHPTFFWINWILIGSFAYFFDSSVYETCLVSMLIYLFAIKNKLHCYLNHFIFQYLGKISYSLYLIHWIVGLKIIDLSIRFFGSSMDSHINIMLLLAFSLSMTFLSSIFFYHLIELPCLNLSKKIKPLRPLGMNLSR